MPISCKGTMKIRCSECGEVLKIPCDNLEFEGFEGQKTTDDYEIEHSANFEFKCGNCGNSVKLTYEILEYPPGSLEKTETKIEGGELIKECNISGYSRLSGVKTDMKSW